MKILYISHITWGWIKQRPQFIAEQLAKENQVDVYYRCILNRKLSYMNRNNCTVGNLRLFPYINLPLYRFFKFLPVNCLEKINKWLWDFNKIDYSQYDLIYLCDSLPYEKIKGKVNPNKILYDCMDDKQAFPQMACYPRYKKYCFDIEKELIKNAGIVTCTADYLRNTLITRFGIQRDFWIINNAISVNLFSQKEICDEINLPENSFTYIGTIAEWFDFELIISVLNKVEDINFVIFGPYGNIPEKYKHPRLIFKGPITHDKVLAAMKSSTGLVMPFIVNDLIRSVNPVKLYEYIYAGKPIAAVRYEETEKFKDFVYLYSTEIEFINFVEETKVCKGCYSKERQNEMKKFASENTWEARIKQIINLIKNDSSK